MTMDSLHRMLRTISTETKAETSHLAVVREFLSHLDKINRKPARALISAKRMPRKIAKPRKSR
jgi:hypothetical protein